MLSENAERIFKVHPKYSFDHETIDDTFKRVAKEFAKNEQDETTAYNLLKDNIWRPNTPVFFNAGTDDKIFSACYVVGLKDSMDSIYDVANVARKIFQKGAGVGIPIGNLREAEAYIYEGEYDKPPEGRSSGPIIFQKLYDAVGHTTKSGGRVRRAAMLCAMKIDHPDIVDFIIAKKNHTWLTNMNLSVLITDKFMQALQDGTPFNIHTPFDGSKVGEGDPQEIWNRLVDNSWNHAEPGVIFIDTVNKFNPLIKDYLVECTNPCIVGDTKIAVADGRNAVSIKQLVKEGKNVPVYSTNPQNGKVEIKIARNPRKTGEKKEVWKLTFEDNSSFIATPNHRVLTNDLKYIELKDLKIGQSLFPFFSFETDNGYRNICNVGKKLKGGVKIKSIEFYGYEDVYNITVDDNHNYHIITKWDDNLYINSAGVCISNCGEQPLTPWNCCNLCAIHLAKYVRKGKKFDWKKLYKDTKQIFRFMDNAIDVMDFPDPRFKEQALKFRPIGVGIMGLADTLFKLDLRYDGPDGRSFAQRAMRTITKACVDESTKLAQENGTFHNYDRYKDDIERIIAHNIDHDEELMEKVQAYGVRNMQFTTCQPTGCLVGDTLISGKGLGVSEIGDLYYKPVENVKTKSDNGEYTYKKWYNQGIQKTVKIITKHGYELQGTYNHKVRVINENGYIWKTLHDINENDYVVMRKNFISDGNETAISWNNDPPAFPYEMAEFLGYYMADGWWQEGRLWLAVNKKDEKYVDNLLKRIQKIFKFNIFKREDDNCYRYDISSKKMYDFCMKNNLIKEGSINAFIPSFIMNSRENLLKFIKGYFKGDGCITERDQEFCFTTVSSKMIKQLQTILLGLGYPSRLYFYDCKDGEKIKIGDRLVNRNYGDYKLYINNYYSHRLGNKIGVDVKYQSKNLYEKIIITESEKQFNKDVLPAYHKEIKEPFEYVSFDKYSKKGNGNWFWDNELYLEQVIKKEYCMEEMVYDMEIKEDGHTYVANGFVTHNTTAISCDASYGMEPSMGLVFQKNLSTNEKMFFSDQTFQDRFKNEKWYNDTLLEKIHNNGGSLKGIHGIPKEVREVFVVAHDINFKDRIRMQAAIQEACSSAISSTINLPKEATKAEISELFKFAYEQGLKGVTVYRDGSRPGQPVTFTKEKKQEEFKRPNKLVSETYSVDTGNGKMYVTVSCDDTGKPIEVFVFLGKSGQILNSQTEALGRVLSLALQSEVPLEKLTKTMKGINSDSIAWHRFEETDQKPTQILSIPDGIAKLLDKYYLKKFEVVTNGGNSSEVCPKCGLNLTAIEGCFACTCGFSKCT